MKTLILASNNSHKITEIKRIFSDKEILSLKDIGYVQDIEENGNTFLENALIKCNAVFEFLKDKGIQAEIIADDSGLCVNALNGAPGIYSARYSGTHGDDQANRIKLLKEMEGKDDRSAYFICCMVKMNIDGSYIFAEGKTYGKITYEEIGDPTTFGYRCIFYSDELKKTFAQATEQEIDRVSHRGRAIAGLIEKEKGN